MMKSIVKDVLSRTEEKKTDPVVQSAPAGQQQPFEYKKAVSNEDEELRRVLAGLRTNIKVVGCGGGGTNTINRLVEEGIVGADLFAMNSDAQHLLTIHAPHKLLLGRRSTRGLGAGAIPQVGEEAALECEEEIRTSLAGSDIVFVTCGLGGGTGTGSAPVVARIARELNALTIAIVTQPFQAEGGVRMQNAEYGLEKASSR